MAKLVREDHRQKIAAQIGIKPVRFAPTKLSPRDPGPTKPCENQTVIGGEEKFVGPLGSAFDSKKVFKSARPIV